MILWLTSSPRCSVADDILPSLRFLRWPRCRCRFLFSWASITGFILCFISALTKAQVKTAGVTHPHPSNSTQSIHSSIMILFLLPDSALKLVLLDAVCINYCERIGCIFGPAHVLRTPTIARLWSNHLHWPKPLQGLSLCYISYHLIISYHHSHSDGKYHCVIMRLSPQPWVLHGGVTLHLSHYSFSLLWFFSF